MKREIEEAPAVKHQIDDAWQEDVDAADGAQIVHGSSRSESPTTRRV